MAVVRLINGDLVLWSPTAPVDDLRKAVVTLGIVRYLIAPNSLHHTFLGDWQRIHPDAKVYAPPSIREKRRDIRFDDDFIDPPIAAWAGEIDHATMWGNRITTEVIFFHRRSRMTIFTDLIQQFPPEWFRGWRGLIAKLDLIVADEPSVPRKFRVAFADRRAAREALRRILAWPTEKVLIDHGPPIIDGGQAFLRRAFRWLAER